MQVTDTPTNLTITNVSGGGCTTLPCTIASMASGASATITVTATINAAGAFDNSATVSVAETDTDVKNNTDDTGNGGSAGSGYTDLVLQKFVLTDVHVGEPFKFFLRVTNPGVLDEGGPDPASGVVLTDPLPPNFSLISATPTHVELKLAIELDGSQHQAAWMADYESERTRDLTRRGVRLLRIPNELLIRDPILVGEWISGVIAEMLAAAGCNREPPHPPSAPSPPCAGEKLSNGSDS